MNTETNATSRDGRTIMISKLALALIALMIFSGPGCGPEGDLKANGVATPTHEATTAATAEAAANSETRTTMAEVTNTNPNLEPVRDIRLESKISKADQAIVITYTVTNTSAADIYVLDAYPAVDQNKREAFADLKSFYLGFREPSSAVLLKGIPPLPRAPVSRRIIPLGTKLAAGEKLNRELTVPLPLRERSDWYYPPLPPEEYAIGSAEKLQFYVQFIRSTVEGFKAEPAHYAPEFFVVHANNTVKQAETLNQDFNIGQTLLFLRKDGFNRL